MRAIVVSLKRQVTARDTPESASTIATRCACVPGVARKTRAEYGDRTNRRRTGHGLQDDREPSSSAPCCIRPAAPPYSRSWCRDRTASRCERCTVPWARRRAARRDCLDESREREQRLVPVADAYRRAVGHRLALLGCGIAAESPPNEMANARDRDVGCTSHRARRGRTDKRGDRRARFPPRDLRATLHDHRSSNLKFSRSTTGTRTLRSPRHGRAGARARTRRGIPRGTSRSAAHSCWFRRRCLAG